MKRILATLLMVATLPLGVVAQQSSTAGVQVSSDPPGASVTLSGDAVVTGITPTFFTYPLIGEYKVKVNMRGFETYKSSVYLTGDSPTSIAVSLSPRTGFKAAVRSMFIPGWGQWYGEQKTKGLLFNVLFAGSVAAFVIADHNFGNKEDEYLKRLDDYNEAVNSGDGIDLTTRWNALAAAQKDAYDAENLRRVTIGSVAGIWGLCLLDALLFTPGQPAIVDIKGLAVEPSAGPDQFGITLVRRF
ncbi:MAG: PEGA domain-containing protein [candidate division Zixibacteria bacterium]|nr:PEGA domain-containing protein [candidate division Zixibacteria bacterium]